MADYLSFFLAGIDPIRRKFIDRCAACTWSNSDGYPFRRHKDGSAYCFVSGGKIASTKEGCDQYDLSLYSWALMDSLFPEKK